MKALVYFLVLVFTAGLAYWFGQLPARDQSLIPDNVVSSAGGAAKAASNDFPTSARAEYVFACMGSSRRSPQMLYACACKIDVIAELISYENYLQAETGSLMRQLPGERYVGFRNSEEVNRRVDRLKNASIEAALRCPARNVSAVAPSP